MGYLLSIFSHFTFSNRLEKGSHQWPLEIVHVLLHVYLPKQLKKPFVIVFYCIFETKYPCIILLFVFSFVLIFNNILLLCKIKIIKHYSAKHTHKYNLVKQFFFDVHLNIVNTAVASYASFGSPNLLYFTYSGNYNVKTLIFGKFSVEFNFCRTRKASWSRINLKFRLGPTLLICEYYREPQSCLNTICKMLI